jgi:hypothetical protein
MTPLTTEQKRKLNSYDPTLSNIGVGVGLGDFLDSITTAVTALETEGTSDDLGAVQSLGPTGAASTAITGATETATNFDTTRTIPANRIVPGSRIKVRAAGTATATTGTETYTLALVIGTTTVYVTGNIDAANSDVFVFDVDIIVRANGDLFAMGWVLTTGAIATGTAKALSATVSSGLPDWTTTNVVAIQIDRQGTATDSDSARLDAMCVDIYDAAA